MTELSVETMSMQPCETAQLQDGQSHGELELLRAENERLAEVNREAFGYIRSKVDALLGVIGTKGLNPEELDDRSLIEFDPIGIVAQTFQHILENLQETNQKLQFAHDEIQTVFDTVGAGILVLDPRDTVVAFNQKVRDLMLGDAVDIRGNKCKDKVCGNDSEDNRCAFSWVIRNRCEQRLSDWRLKGRSFDVIGRPMFDDNGRITHVILAYHDVSAQREAQSALLAALEETRETNTKINGILRSAADGILVTDASDKIVLMNRRAEELLDPSPHDRTASMTFERIGHAGLVSLLRQAPYLDTDTFSEDLIFPLSGDSSCICQARITVIRSAHDEFNGCITLLHDVTEQRAIDRMKDEFVSTAAHELRTPLATIIGYADLLQMDNDYTQEQQAEFLKQIQKKAERLGDIVSDLLDISRIESGQGVKLDAKPNRLDTLCDDLVKSSQLQSPEHTFVLDFSSNASALVNFDRYAMLQIIENLLSNAVKYSPEGGEVRISGRIENGSYRLTISDQGIGMTPGQVEKIYEKFYRADATNTAISGTGLGMTIVKYLVEAQSGQVNVSSTPGHGTAVSITLPVAPEHSR